MPDVKFITVSDFKKQTGVLEFQVLKNKKTDKLFVALPDGGTMRCQQDFDPKKPIQFIVDEGADIREACLINYDNTKGADSVASF